jgi:hypothetical protein
MVMYRAITLSLLIAAAACGGAEDEVTLPAGTEIKIRLEEDLKGGENLSGETFHATLAAPLSIDGKLLARAGAPVWGDLTTDGSRERLTMRLRSVEVNGQSHLLEAAPLTVEPDGIGPNAVLRVPLAKPLELPPQPE